MWARPWFVPCRLITYRLVESSSDTMKKHHSSHRANSAGSSGTSELSGVEYVRDRYVTIAALSPMMNDPSCSSGIFCRGFSLVNSGVFVSPERGRIGRHSYFKSSSCMAQCARTVREVPTPQRMRFCDITRAPPTDEDQARESRHRESAYARTNRLPRSKTSRPGCQL